MPASGRPAVVLGEYVFRGKRQRFGMYEADRLRHTWVIGKTGSGKSNLLSGLLAQDMEKGRGCALLDPHGDLARTALALTPPSRVNDVMLFDPSDTEYPLSFNVFRAGRNLHPRPALLASELITVFRKQWSDSWGPRLEHVLRNAIIAVAHDERATLVFLYRFLTDERLREKVVERLSDPVVSLFWTREFCAYSPRFQGEILSPVLNKLGAFIANPLVRNIVGQERSRVDLVDVMQRGRIFIANLSTGAIGEDASHLLGGMLLTSLQLAAMQRPRGGPDFIAYVDEFQHFVTESLSTILSESRKFGLGLVLAHQYLAQLPLSLRDAVLGNVGTMLVFRLGAADAQVLEGEFEPAFTASELQSLPPYHVAVKLLVNGRSLPPFLAATLRAPAERATAAATVARITAQSRLRYGAPRERAEAAVIRSLA